MSSQKIAVIDIGSYTVRLVVYELTPSEIHEVFDDKAVCGLIHDLDLTGRMSDAGVALALETLDHFAHVIEDLEIKSVYALATAASREAKNGPEFVQKAEKILGVPLRVLTGVEEAYYAGMSTLAAIPDALGICGDLGGGSLELTRIEDHHPVENQQISLPLGHLRMADHIEAGEDVDAVIHQTLSEVAWLDESTTPTFYAIGGRWRDVAKLYCNRKKEDPDAYSELFSNGLSVSAKKLSKFLQKKIIHHEKRHDEPVYPAAIVMQGIIDIIQPKEIVFIHNSLREGFLYASGLWPGTNSSLVSEK